MLGPSRLFGEPSRAELFDKASRAEPSRAEPSRAEPSFFAFKTEPNRAFRFPKLSNFWLFSLNFFKEYNFLDEKIHFYWCLQDYTLKNWQKCWKSAHFLFFKQTELNRAFLQDMASRAELFCPKAWKKTKLSQAEWASAQTQHYQIYYPSKWEAHLCPQ